nr:MULTISPECIES: 4Fe-4S binding protein [unclassified Bradyrhizobium]
MSFGTAFERDRQWHRSPKESEGMAYKIVASQCTVCGACEFECPNAAISLKRDIYVIDAKKCTECEGHSDTPQCAVVCPVPDTCVPSKTT